jgi:osmotically-inducible protein OsmY
MDDENETEIDGSNRTLQAAVKSALTSAYDINASDITVSTMGSYVILQGRARNRGDIHRVIEIAEEIAGEGKVKSRLINR